MFYSDYGRDYSPCHMIIVTVTYTITAAHVHACEWNPNAVEALRRGLVRNHVSDRCTVHSGDNVKVVVFIIPW
mgnify:CR=1 FL=1